MLQWFEECVSTNSSIEMMHSFESEWVVRLRIRNRYVAFYVFKRQQNEQKSKQAIMQ